MPQRGKHRHVATNGMPRSGTPRHVRGQIEGCPPCDHGLRGPVLRESDVEVALRLAGTKVGRVPKGDLTERAKGGGASGDSHGSSA